MEACRAHPQTRQRGHSQTSRAGVCGFRSGGCSSSAATAWPLPRQGSKATPRQGAQACSKPASGGFSGVANDTIYFCPQERSERGGCSQPKCLTSPGTLLGTLPGTSPSGTHKTSCSCLVRARSSLPTAICSATLFHHGGGQVRKVLCLPRSLRFEVHKVLRLPRNLHFEVHKVPSS